MTYLIVNDFGQVVDVIKRLLYILDNSCEIYTANTSFEGLSILKQNERYIDNVIVDFNLPDVSIYNFLDETKRINYNKRIAVICLEEDIHKVSEYIKSHLNSDNILITTKPLDKHKMMISLNYKR